MENEKSWEMKGVKKVRDNNVDVDKCVTLTKKWNDSIATERIKMTKWL